MGAASGPKEKKGTVTVLGGGLAGCEAAWQLARRGIKVTLFEARPALMTPAHRTGRLAEIVCSNSFRSDLPESAPGQLKWEMEELDSLIIRCARETAVPGGKALVFDRDRFAERVETVIAGEERINVVREEARRVPDPPVILATGPLSSEAVTDHLLCLMGGADKSEPLFFYDAIAPIVAGESLDRNVIFSASRYGEGEQDEGDYLNAPFTEEEYRRFIAALREGELAGCLLEEDRRYFERCMPIEEMARRGEDTPRFGPMKPVGLVDPRSGRRPYAVLQLRREDLEGEYYNLVGFQTQLRQGEQERIFRMIPGLERAAFLRFGSAHRNTFIDAPRHLGPDLMLRDHPGIWVAGQLAGVEGYIESAAAGLAAGIFAAGWMTVRNVPLFPKETLIGSLLNYISNENIKTKKFQPMKVNLGLLSLPEQEGTGKKVKKADRQRLKVERARTALKEWKREGVGDE